MIERRGAKATTRSSNSKFISALAPSVRYVRQNHDKMPLRYVYVLAFFFVPLGVLTSLGDLLDELIPSLLGTATHVWSYPWFVSIVQ